MRKTLSMILAVCMSLLSVLSLFACGTIDAPAVAKDARYYRYNAEVDLYNKTEYMEIDGNKCTLVKNNNGITVTSVGTISFSGDSFTVTCTSELLGINITNVMNGVKESEGVLRVDSQTVIGMTATPTTDYETIYYCLDGVKPESPKVQYTITFDGNGGSFDGETKIAVKTDTDGTVSLPMAPTRSGYDFVGYFQSKTGDNDAPITSSTVFERSMTVYARWTERNARADRYYYYNSLTDSLNENDYIDIDGTSVMMVTISGGTTVRNSGTVVFVGNSFTITIITQSTFIFRGEKQDNGILRFTSVKVISEGTEIEDSSVFYYCPQGVKPPKQQGDNNGDGEEEGVYEITFNAAPGKFPDGTQTKKIKTDRNGKLKSMPDNPTYTGHKFMGFETYSQEEVCYVTVDMVFKYSTTVYADYKQFYTVTFMVENTVVETRDVEPAQPLGEYDIPKSPDVYKYFKFKCWRQKNSTYYYTANSLVFQNLTLVAEFYTQNDVEKYKDSMWSWTKSGHLYIHYLRKYGEVYDTDDPVVISMAGTEYEDWLLWAWPRNGEGRAYEPIRTGMLGIVYDIDMKKTYTDGGWNATTLTDQGKSVYYYGKDLGIMIFDDKSRYDGSGMWKNDGGNLFLNVDPVFLYSEYDGQGNELVKDGYYFDKDVSIHLLFEQGYMSQNQIDNHAIGMIVYLHDIHQHS